MKELDSLIKNIKNKELLPLYFLHGPEHYYIDQLVKVLENDVLEEEEKAFNQIVVYGKDTTYQEVLAMARQFPMMGDKMEIIVKEAQDMKLNDDEAHLLIQYAENPVESTVLVFAHKGKKLDGKKRKLIAALKNYLFLSDTIPEWNLEKVIQAELNKQKIKTEPNIPSLLAEHLGNNLTRIFNELNKVKIVLKENQILDAAIVEKYIGISKDYNIFELQKAIATKDSFKAYKIIHYMRFGNDNNISSIIAVLFNYFSKVIVYHTLKDTSRQNVASELGISPNFVQDYQRSANLFPLKHATRVITILREADMKVKGYGTRKMTEQEILTEMVFKIVNVDKTKVKI